MIFRISLWHRVVIVFQHSLWIILDQFIDDRRCVCRLQDLFHQTGDEKDFCFFLLQGIRLAWYAQVNSFDKSRLWLGESLGFPFENKTSPAKVTTLSSALASVIATKNNCVTATLTKCQICVSSPSWIETKMYTHDLGDSFACTETILGSWTGPIDRQLSRWRLLRMRRN